MAELKTKKTGLSVEDFLNQIADKQKQHDAFTLLALMEKESKAKGKMWGTSIVGFGDQHMVYDSGRELDWFVIGFSPRKQNFALYIPGTIENQKELLQKLGKHKTGGGCLYINKLDEVDMKILKEIVIKGLKK